MKKLLILIVGQPSSGKSLAANIIVKKFNASLFHAGDIIRDEIKRRNLKYTAENDTKIANWFHSNNREKLIALRAWKKVKNKRPKLIIIEGFRNTKQLNYLKKQSKQKIILISITANKQIRIKRAKKRKRFKKSQVIQYLKSRDKREKSLGLPKLMKKANYKITNNSTKKNLERKVVKLTNKLKLKYL